MVLFNVTTNACVCTVWINIGVLVNGSTETRVMFSEPYPEHVDVCFHAVVNSLTIDQREVVLMDELALVKEFLSSFVAPLGIEALLDQTCEFCPANYNPFIFQGVQ